MAEPLSNSSVSTLPRAWGQGDTDARDALLPLVYRELREQATRYLRQERRDYTLQPTALVHEAYLRLIAQEHVSWQNRAHFLALAAKMMRRILVDHARKHQAAKRPSRALKVEWNDQIGASVRPRDSELLLLDQALRELEANDPRQGEVVELRYFGGLSEQEVAEVLHISRATITREWRSARAWLFRRITRDPREVRGD
jgi:RNA polymerase sigma-70 factor (ECF subfamily)